MNLLRRTLRTVVRLVALLGIVASSALAQTVLTFEPDTLDFVQVEGGGFADATFTITNVSSDTVTGSVQSSTGVFQAIDGAGEFTLAAGDTLDVVVRFTPSAARIFDDSLAINYNVGDSAYVGYVYMIGTGAEGDSVVVSIPDSVDFGSVEIGQSATVTMQIINNSDSARFVGLVADLSGAFSVVGNPDNLTVEAGDTLDVALTFTPTMPGPISDTLTITYLNNFALETANVVLTGIGVAVAVVDTVSVSVTPEDVDFGSVRVGATAMQTVFVTNTSDSARLVGTVVQADGAFSVVGGVGPFSLAAGESRAITIAFSPTVAQTYSDSLMISFLGTAGVTDSVFVGLTGVGTPAETPVVSVSVQPGVVLFGNVAVGDTGTRSVTITNTSDAAVVAGTVLPAGAGMGFSVDAGLGAFMLLPGQSHTITLEFAPSVTGLAVDSLSITYAAGLGLETEVVTLIGAGIEATSGGSTVVGISPATIEFGTTTVGTTLQQQFTISNPSTTDTLRGTILNPSAPFYIDAAAGAFVLAPLETRTVTVFYTPLVAGSFSDNIVLSYASGDSSGVMLVRLTGSASVTTGIAGERSASRTLSIAAYPQPTTDRASIRYASERGGHVRIAIVDARGQEVARLLDAVVAAGEHTLDWSADGVPAGVYVVTMRTVDEMTSSRITVVR